MKPFYDPVPKGYRVRKVGEIRRASDLTWSILIDSTAPCHWHKLDSYDRESVGTRINHFGPGWIPWAAKIVRKKKRRSKK